MFRPQADLARVLLALAPLLGAALIAISRCEDYRHDVYDVTTGSILGMLMAFFSYRRYYPGLGTSHCDQPFPSRAELASTNGFAKLKDEEARIQGDGAFAIDELDDNVEYVPLQPLRDTNRDDGRLIGSSSESQG